MSNNIHFELVSPEKKLISQDVYSVQIPGDDGEFGILANHSSLLSSLKPGVVKLYETDGASPRNIFIAGGFADVSATNCTVLAEEAIPVEDLNRESLEQHLKDLNDDLAMASEPADKRRVHDKIVLVKAKIEATA